MDLAPKRWTLNDWDKMIETGLVGEDDRVLLLDGEIYQMCAQNSPHATALGLTEDALKAVVLMGTHVRVQLPLYLGRASDPEPDLAVVAGARRDYARAHPNSALLVVEISDASLAFDCGRKAQAYARHGIAEYWVLDIKGRCLHRFTNPHEVGYTNHEALTPEECLSWGGQTIRVGDLLP